MVVNGHEWWTDQRVEATVTKHFIYAHLQPEQADQLTKPVFADLSDKTYLQWILLKAKRLFLILIHIGASGEILRLIEDSYDDDDLPFAADDVTSLGLSRDRGQHIDVQFYRCQFKYLVRVVGNGEHIRYARDELVPLEKVDSKVNSAQNSFERVKTPSPTNQVFLVKRVRLSGDRTELDILSEIASTKPLSHQHTLSVFGSYTQNDCMNVLITPAAKYTLGSFLADRPKAFELLPKPDRRLHLVIWPLCLANALAWLHCQGAHHAAIRPSRIFIDDNHSVTLGYFGADWILGSRSSEDDLEAYSYAAPELWKRGLTVQAQDTSGISFLAGGRSAFGRRDVGRETNESRLSSDNNRNNDSRQFGISTENKYAFVPTLKGGSSRLKLEMSSESSRMTPDPLKRIDSNGNSRSATPFDSIRRQPSLARRYENMPSRTSNSSEGNRRSETFRSERLYSVAPDTKNTAVQTWKSTAADLPATDMFGLAAVTMDILTVLCSRTVSSFAKHRAAKNRQAGRGGGVADSSFHANLPQVGTWAELVHKDAEKKLKKNSGDIFRAIGPVLQIVMQCLDREPQRRLRASTFSQRLESHLSEFANIQKPHCRLTDENDRVDVGDPAAPTTSHLRKEVPIEKLALTSAAEPSPQTTIQNDYKPLTLPMHGTGSSLKLSSSPTQAYPEVMSDDGTSATYCHSLTNASGQVSKEVQDLYDLCDDLDSTDTQFVRVKPRQRDAGRFVADFTNNGLHSRTESITSSYNGMEVWRNDYSESVRTATPTGTKASHITFSLYPPATPPPNRQLPASPRDNPRVKSQRSAIRQHPMPPADIYHANSMLASAARGSIIKDVPPSGVPWPLPLRQASEYPGQTQYQYQDR